MESNHENDKITGQHSFSTFCSVLKRMSVENFRKHFSIANLGSNKIVLFIISILRRIYFIRFVYEFSNSTLLGGGGNFVLHAKSILITSICAKLHN